MGKQEYLKEKLNEFVENLKKEISVETIVFFGSRARGEFEEDSDVDLIIVSKDFVGKNFFERVKGLYDLWKIDLPVDFLCYTPQEFNKLKKKISIISEALKEGIVLK